MRYTLIWEEPLWIPTAAEAHAAAEVDARLAEQENPAAAPSYLQMASKGWRVA